MPLGLKKTGVSTRDLTFIGWSNHKGDHDDTKIQRRKSQTWYTTDHDMHDRLERAKVDSVQDEDA